MTPRAWYATKATALLLAICFVVVIAPIAIIGVFWLLMLPFVIGFILLVIDLWIKFHDSFGPNGDSE